MKTQVTHSLPLPPLQCRLRILATTDLHAHLSAWDYYLDRPADGHCLARVASLLRAARVEEENCLYFDNGDLIEGGPLAEFAVQAKASDSAQHHPMVAALNALGCDAAALGNHEFSYGIPFLEKVMSGAGYPVLSANILRGKGPTVAADQPFFQPWTLLERSFADSAGGTQRLRIGVLGLTPPQVLDWDRALLSHQLNARGMVEAAAHYLPLIRAAGADIVVVLAHCGVGRADGPETGENVGVHLATLPGIDVLVLGHEHQVFPLPGDDGPDGGKLSGVPVVVPGAFGSHLGVVDLDLRQGDAGWMVTQSRAHCRAVATRGSDGAAVPLIGPDAAITALAQDSHQATRAFVAQPVGASDVPLHSYFALAQPSAIHTLIAAAQAAHLAEFVRQTAWEGLPILSATAPFKTGGRGGPDYFTDVPAGILLMRHAADLYLYPNRFAALVLNGAGLRDWLERAATAYTRVTPGLPDKPLLHPDFPATCLEMIAGLTYRIDLSAPAGFDAPTGQRTGQPGRIRDLCYQGRPVTDVMRFALATNSHRLGMLMGVSGAMRPEVISDGTGAPGSREVLLRYLARGAAVPPRQPPDWGFCSVPGARVTLDTSPNAVAYLQEIAHFAPQTLGLTADGFMRFRLHL